MGTRRFNHIALICYAIGLASGLPDRVIAAVPGWELAWQDDFDEFDERVWRRVHSTEPTNDSRHAYLPEQVTAAGGKLIITSTDEPYEGLPFRSGQVISRSEQRFGRWEARAKLPTSRGMWPAIWLLPDVAKHAWPSGGEIDVMENRGDEPFVTISAFHYGAVAPALHEFVQDEQSTTIDGRRVNYHDSFHTYAVDWTSRYLRFYVDGVNHLTVFDEDVGGFLSKQTQPMQLVINNAIGGTFLDDADDTTQWPQRMEVDWVRVYKPSGSPGRVEFQNGGFEQGGGGLAGWSLFGIQSERVSAAMASTEAALEGDFALKLSGPGEHGERFSGVLQGATIKPGDEVTAALSAFVGSEEGLADGENRVLLKLEFYSEFGAKYGSDALLAEHETVVADATTRLDSWRPHELQAIAPEGAVEARLAIVFHQPEREPGSVRIDKVELRVFDPLSTADFNGDGRIDAADFTVWSDAARQGVYDPRADANADGRVDNQDREIWIEAYKASRPARKPAVKP